MFGAEPLTTLYYLLLVCLVLLLVVVIQGFLILKRLKRGSRSPSRESKGTTSSKPAVQSSPGGSFEAFLAETPAAHHQTKGEQFAAYRKWRQARGLNWAAPGNPGDPD